MAKCSGGLQARSVSGTRHFYSHSVRDYSGIWQYLTAKIARECSVAGQPFSQHFNSNGKKGKGILKGSNVAPTIIDLSLSPP